MGPPQAFSSSPILTISVSHGLLNSSSSPRLGVQFRTKEKHTLWHSRLWTIQNTIGQNKTEANSNHHLSPSVMQMATKALSIQSRLHPNLSHTFNCCSNLKANWDLTSHQPWLARRTTPRRRLVLHASLLHEYPLVVQHLHLHAPNSLIFLLTETVGYSVASYYTSLGLFVISIPGLWSLIKRSVKSKIVQKTYIGDGEVKKEPKQVAGEILSFFTRNNFVVTNRGDTITFEGMMVPSRGQAALLTFCTCISMASVALVLTITFPDFGNNWFWLTILSPLAGAYYWRRASRKEQIKVKVVVADDGMLSEIIVQGDDQQVEQMRKELRLSEKGMVYVKGLFER